MNERKRAKIETDIIENSFRVFENAFPLYAIFALSTRVGI